MIPLDSARSRVLAGCAPLHPRAVPVPDALGCVTSVELTAEEHVPPFANTAMDGFAVRAADTSGAPVRLRIVATLAAGAAPERAVGQGEAIRIMTGAPMPDGADAVVMVERTSVDGDEVVIEQAAAAGDHVRAAGSDLAPGQVLFPAGTVLSPAHLGVLASLGYRNVPVFPRARVGVLSTGDELVDDDRPLAPGQIRDSNRPMLVALLREANCVPVDLGLAPDRESDITAALEQGLAECDALVTSGGVSMGDFDYVKAVLDRMGDMQWMQVAIKPAKPLAFGVVGGKPVFGLPGNPVSSLVSFEVFARPALRQMMGHRRIERLRVQAIAEEGLLRRPDGKTHFVRVVGRYDDAAFRVRSSGGQASHQLGAMAAANALVVLPDGEGVEAGGLVEAILLSPP
ncbi:MAG: molybdopterin molybdotransferase MoeA [Actinomycetota bacterium]